LKRSPINIFLQDLITKCPVELHTILNDPKLEVGAVEMLGPDLFAVPYQHRREFVRPHDKYNIVIALMTTANARCRLYHYMKCIHMTPGCILLYTGRHMLIRSLIKRRPFRYRQLHHAAP
jgi:hypothetical protein